jgi:hypothetical protein
MLSIDTILTIAKIYRILSRQPQGGLNSRKINPREVASGRRQLSAPETRRSKDALELHEQASSFALGESRPATLVGRRPRST